MFHRIDLLFDDPSAASAVTGNLLLAALHPDDRRLLQPHLERITLGGGDRIAASTSPVTRVCFPETLVASFSEVMADRTRYEIGMIGREGMVGWPVLLGSAHPAHSGIVQLGGGTTLVLPAERLLALCAESQRLRIQLLQFVQSFTVQMSRTIVSNLRDGIDGRLARWLLMLHDRIDGDALTVTHHALAGVLHVRRASVTDWLHILEGERVVRSTRGEIIIRDRAGLEARAGDAYGAAELTYRTLIAPFGKPRS